MLCLGKSYKVLGQRLNIICENINDYQVHWGLHCKEVKWGNELGKLSCKKYEKGDQKICLSERKKRRSRSSQKPTHGYGRQAPTCSPLSSSTLISSHTCIFITAQVYFWSQIFTFPIISNILNMQEKSNQITGSLFFLGDQHRSLIRRTCDF